MTKHQVTIAREDVMLVGGTTRAIVLILTSLGSIAISKKIRGLIRSHG